MISQKLNGFNNRLQKGLLLGVFFGFALVILGWILVPTINVLGVFGVCLVLGIYGFVFYFGIPRIRPEILHWASIFALLAGIVFVGEILLEYVVLPKDNTNWGLVEFGSVFFLYFLSSLWAAYKTERLHSGILSAVLTAMISVLIWLIVILIMFYAFRGTDRQAHVFLAEGNYQDFSYSGMTDFNTFIMEDFLGAGFFHLLLGPMVAIILGSIGGLIGIGLAKLRSHLPG